MLPGERLEPRKGELVPSQKPLGVHADEPGQRETGRDIERGVRVLERARGVPLPVEVVAGELVVCGGRLGGR